MGKDNVWVITVPLLRCRVGTLQAKERCSLREPRVTSTKERKAQPLPMFFRKPLYRAFGLPEGKVGLHMYAKMDGRVFHAEVELPARPPGPRIERHCRFAW